MLVRFILSLWQPPVNLQGKEADDEFTFRPDIDSHLALYIVKARNSSERQEGTTQRGWVEMVNASLMSDMLTIREVSRMLHVHSNTLRRWSDQGKIRSYRIADRGDRRFLRQDVARFISELNAPLNGETDDR